MKKQKNKKLNYKKSLILFFSFFIMGVVFGAGTVKLSIAPQLADDPGSYNSIVSFTGGTKQGYYINLGDNSAIIGNYFEGYYYDSLFGFFKTDWSSDKSQNVRIVGSVGDCSTGYGYKLGGKAKNENGGYIDFNYSNGKYVYYCNDDKSLHGIAYSKYIGEQDFEGITFEIVSSASTIIEQINDDIFINDTSSINQVNSAKSSESRSTSNIGGDINNLDDTKESIFYIIK